MKNGLAEDELEGSSKCEIFVVLVTNSSLESVVKTCNNYSCISRFHRLCREWAKTLGSPQVAASPDISLQSTEKHKQHPGPGPWHNTGFRQVFQSGSGQRPWDHQRLQLHPGRAFNQLRSANKTLTLAPGTKQGSVWTNPSDKTFFAIMLKLGSGKFFTQKKTYFIFDVRVEQRQ